MSTDNLDLDLDLDLDMDSMMDESIDDAFDGAASAGLGASNERLKEMNKKLPSWDLEPPYSFLK